MEFGEDIDHFLSVLKNHTRNEFAIIADKTLLDREDWRSVKNTAGLPDNWDEMARHLWISRPLKYPAAGDCFTDRYVERFRQGLSIAENFPIEKFGTACGGFPIYDAGGKNVGAILALVDASDRIAIFNKTRLYAIAAFIGTSSAIGAALFYLSRRITNSIRRLHKGIEVVAGGNLDYRIGMETGDEIGELSRVFDEMVAKRKEAEEQLKGHKELSALYEVSSVLSSSIEMEKLFSAILDAITGIELLGVKRTGGIFLIEGESMRLVSHLGHTEEFLNLHRGMKVGDCLCGLSAKTKEIIISPNSETDVRHTIRYPKMTPHGHIIIPLKAHDAVIGVMYLYLQAMSGVSKGMTPLLASIGNQVGLAISNTMLYEETKALSLHDSLTGAANRRHMELVLQKWLSEAERYERPLSAIMLDIDHFKEYNDKFGHPAGDRILTNITKLITEEVREVDLVSRYGGEEFLVLLPETGLSEAGATAERIRKLVERETEVTVSLGVAVYPSTENEPLVKRADMALYQAKRNGRNRTIISGFQ